MTGASRAAQERDWSNSAQVNFTPREKYILHLLGEGYSTKEAAQELGVSPFTVTRHLQNLFEKTGVHSRLALTILAIRSGIILLPL